MIEGQRGWRRMQRRIAGAVLCAALVASLQGCIGVVMGGAAVVGSLAATDRRTLGAQTEDRGIMLKGESRVAKLVGDSGHVNVNSYNRKVLLTGEVKDEQTKAAVEHEIAGLEGVQSIDNNLVIAGVSSFTSRSNDTVLTGKVKASLVDSKELYANSFKVVTENSTVYLMGRVTQREGQLAADIARGVSGVQRVVKIFDYINEDELNRMTTMPPAEPQKPDQN